MPKPTKAEQEVESKKKLPDVVELKFEGYEEVTLLLQKLSKLQEQVGQKPEEKKGKVGSGLLADIHTIKSQLSAIMAVEGLPGLRHNNLVFSDCWIDGKETVVIKDLMVELAMEGVEMEIIKKCIAAATKTGEGYLRRQLVDLNKPRGSWDD